MKRIKSMVKYLFLALCLLTVAGQSSLSVFAEGEKVKMGTLSVGEPLFRWMEEDLKKQGIEIEIVTFTENQQPAIALSNGDIDGFIVNQKVWLDQFNKSNNTDLLMLEPYIYFTGFGAYSDKYDKIEDLPDHAKVAIPGNPVNMERAMTVLQHAGVIKLGEKLGELYTTADIIENPKNLEFIEMEQTVVARSIKDVDAVVCTSSYLKDAGHDANDYLFKDPDAANFPYGLVVQPKDKDAEWAKAIIEITQSESWRKQFDDHFQGARTLIDAEE